MQTKATSTSCYKQLGYKTITVVYITGIPRVWKKYPPQLVWVSQR